MSFSAPAKRVVEATLRKTLGRPGRMRGRALILAFHNVVPEEVAGLGDQSLHFPLGRFVRQVTELARQCRVEPLSDILHGKRDPLRPSVAITFDDAYAGAVELALPALARLGLPSTMFVAPGMLGQPGFWWDRLASPGAELDPRLRSEALHALAGRTDLIATHFEMDLGKPPLSPWHSCAEEPTLLAAAQRCGVLLGSHSWSHANLSRLSPVDVEAELTQSLTWLRESKLPVAPVIAYPYGLSTPAVHRAAASAGYSQGLRVEGGWMAGAAAHGWEIPRLNVPAGLSDDGFLLRLSGYFCA